MRGVQKLADRCATGGVIAAPVLAAAVFAVSKAGPKAFGYPVVTIVLVGLAVLAAIWLWPASCGATFLRTRARGPAGSRRPATIGDALRGWCNRQHDRFWPCYWGFESSPPSFISG